MKISLSENISSTTGINISILGENITLRNRNTDYIEITIEDLKEINKFVKTSAIIIKDLESRRGYNK